MFECESELVTYIDCKEGLLIGFQKLYGMHHTFLLHFVTFYCLCSQWLEFSFILHRNSALKLCISLVL